MASAWDNPEQELPIKISCTKTECQLGLHYYGPRNRKNAAFKENGKCKDCDADLVDWALMNKRDPGELQKTIAMLKTEWIRHHFWNHYTFSPNELAFAKRCGVENLVERFKKAVLRVCVENPPHYVYHQTKYSGVIPCTQHATATCCPECVEYWHGIPQGCVPNAMQLEYLARLAVTYFQGRLMV